MSVSVRRQRGALQMQPVIVVKIQMTAAAQVLTVSVRVSHTFRDGGYPHCARLWKHGALTVWILLLPAV